MKKALIMADDLILSYAFAEKFSAEGWSADTTSTLSLFDVEATRTKNYACMILVINPSMKHQLLEHDTLTDQCMYALSRSFPLYVVFEHAYDKAVDRHLRFARRVFDQAHTAARINEIVAAIVNPDPEVVDYTAFVSPMSSI